MRSFFSDGVVCPAVALLLVELPHLRELSMIGAIIGDELCGHRDGLGAVNLKVGARTEEVVSAQPVWLDIGTVLVANAAETVLTIDSGG